MATSISFEPTTVNLTVYKGDSINIKFKLIEDGAEYVIPGLGTGSGWKGSIKKSSDSTFAGALTISGLAQSSFFTIYASNAITTNLVPGTTYKYDIQYNWSESGVTYNRTFVKGEITVLSEVTLPTDA